MSGSGIKRYEIRVTPANKYGLRIIDTLTRVNSWAVVGLEPSTNYSFDVRAINNDNKIGPWSTTVEKGMPTPPTTTTFQIVTTTTTTTVDTGDWQRGEIVDEMDGTRTVIVKLVADSLVLGWLGDWHEVSLNLTCLNETTPTVTLGIDGEDFDTDYYNNEVIRLKFDDESPYTLEEDGGSSYNEFFFLSSVWPPALVVESVNFIVSRFLNASTLKVELTPWYSYKQVVSFDLAGLAPFLPELREMCNW